MIFLSFILIGLGLLCIILFKVFFLIAVGVFLVGFGYGMAQPLIYDKTTLAARPEKAIFALAFTMSTNYIGVLACPFILDFFEIIFHNHNQLFPFVVNMIMAFGVAFFAFIFQRKIIFNGKSSI